MTIAGVKKMIRDGALSDVASMPSGDSVSVAPAISSTDIDTALSLLRTARELLSEN